MKVIHRVAVCGGRNLEDLGTVWSALDVVRADIERVGIEMSLVHGGCRGADKLAASWAVYNQIDCTEVAADWNQHGRKAGPIRNQLIIDDYAPHSLVVFKGGLGTADMVRRARKAGVQLLRFDKETA